MKPHDVIGSRYTLDRKIGEGGTGQIWLAHDSRLDRRVAIKFLFAHTALQQARWAKRVALEAKIAASIQHPNVIQIFDFGTHEGIPYIVMEALFGFTLGEAFDSCQSFSFDTLIQVMSDVLRGLSAVHDGGIVHRDLKPENIFLAKDSRGNLSPKLLDFGISRSLEPEMRPSAVTTTEGLIVGTPQYMSPEQASGDSEIDKRTDIYSVGTIMFEAFSGFVPFPMRRTADLLIAVIHDDAPPLFEKAPAIGRALCDVVDKALSKERNARYAHAAEMLDALLAAANALPPELDRQASMFPPEEAIRHRTAHKRAAEGAEELENGADPAAPPALDPGQFLTPDTVQEPVIQRRGRRTRPSERPPLLDAPLSALPLGAATVTAERPFALALGSRGFWLTVAGLASFAVSLALAVALFARGAEPEGSGLIVVQAPAQNPTPAPREPAIPPAPSPPAATVPPVSLDERTDSKSKRAAMVKAKKSSASSDPLQLMAARVADAFSKQKTSVVACLNEHAADLEGSPQLHVRLQIDRSGIATNAELLPEAIANKPVARCLETAVEKMSFPRPEQPTTFRVPLLWRRK